MANIKSAKKRARQTVVRNARNASQRSMLRSSIRKVLHDIDAKDKAEKVAKLDAQLKDLDALAQATEFRK